MKELIRRVVISLYVSRLWTRKEVSNMDNLDALKVIRDVCKSNDNCDTCPFRNDHDDCRLTEIKPYAWRLPCDDKERLIL